MLITKAISASGQTTFIKLFLNVCLSILNIEHKSEILRKCVPSNFPNLHKHEPTRTKINSFLSVIAVIVLVRRIADMMPQEVKCEYLFAIDLILVMILIMQCIDNQVGFFFI